MIQTNQTASLLDRPSDASFWADILPLYVYMIPLTSAWSTLPLASVSTKMVGGPVLNVTSIEPVELSADLCTSLVMLPQPKEIKDIRDFLQKARR